MVPSPLAAIGVPVHDGEAFVEEALDSLQLQTGAVIVAVDDCSTDRSRELVAARSIPLLPFDERLGLVEAWRRAFAFALETAPNAEYFAWGSDHDVWNRGWLEALAGALDNNPDAVLAYPFVERIDEQGAPRKSTPAPFDTVGVRDPLERVRRANARMRAGDMVYGLYRIDALLRCGPFPAALLPDRLLLGRLALEGEFVQIERPLWRRRYRAGVVPSLARQRSANFAPPAPLRSYLPWWCVHALAFWRSLGEPRRRRIRPTFVYVSTAYTAVKRERLDAARRRRRKRRRAALARAAAIRRSLPQPVVALTEPIARTIRRGAR